MPWEDPDAADPMLLVGLALPADAGADRDMAWAFAEELARSGYSVARIVGVFREPWYAGAHRAYLSLGEAAIETIARRTVEVFGRMRIVDREPAAAGPSAASRPCSSCAGEEPTHE